MMYCKVASIQVARLGNNEVFLFLATLDGLLVPLSISNSSIEPKPSFSIGNVISVSRHEILKALETWPAYTIVRVDCDMPVDGLLLSAIGLEDYLLRTCVIIVVIMMVAMMMVTWGPT